MSENQPEVTRAVPLHGGAVAAILKLLDAQSLMTLASNNPEGHPHVSTVGYVNDGLNIYFVTAKGSEKAKNILADSRVGAAIRGRAEEGEAIGVSLDGRAHLVEGDEITDLYARIEAGTRDQAPFAPAHDDVLVFKLVPHRIKAVAVIEGHSRAQTYAVGDAEAVTEGVTYEPSAIARLF